MMALTVVKLSRMMNKTDGQMDGQRETPTDRETNRQGSTWAVDRWTTYIRIYQWTDRQTDPDRYRFTRREANSQAGTHAHIVRHTLKEIQEINIVEQYTRTLNSCCKKDTMTQRNIALQYNVTQCNETIRYLALDLLSMRYFFVDSHENTIDEDNYHH